MKLKSLFSKKEKIFDSYANAKHADVYERIAEKLSTSPQHVYEIAHGKSVRTFDDRVIWSELVMEGIVHY